MLCHFTRIQRPVQHILAIHLVEGVADGITVFTEAIAGHDPVAHGIIVDGLIQLPPAPGVPGTLLHVRLCLSRNGAVCTQCGMETTLRIAHLCQGKIKCGTCGVCILRATGTPDCIKIGTGNERLVIKHLFEVRHTPLKIRGITVKAPTQLIMDAARGHLVKR